MNMQTKYYVNVARPDKQALAKCLLKAIEIAQKDKEVKKIVLYGHTKNNFEVVTEIFGIEKDNLFRFNLPQVNDCPIPIICETKITYKRKCDHGRGKTDIVVCLQMDSKDIFCVEDMYCVKYIVALPWTLKGISEWAERWNAQDIDSKKTQREQQDTNPILKIALDEMDKRMFGTKNLGHSRDAETCKTYIRTIHKYIPDATPSDIQNYLVAKLKWENSDAKEVGNLLLRLKEGRTFQGGQKTYLKEYFQNWGKKAN